MHSDERKDVSWIGDFQIERPTARSSQGEARLIEELQAMYEQEKNVSIERVWMRLMQQRTGTDATVFESQQPGASGSQQQRQFSERNGKMQQRERIQTSQKGLPRVFGLLAAALVSIVLVGSLLLVLNMTKSTPRTTVTGSQSTTGMSTVTATPLSSPECRDTSNLTEQQLCLEHKEALLNLPKTFGTHKVLFLRAYADTTQLMLIYTTSGPAKSDAISFISLKIQQGITLSGGASTSYQNPKTHEWYYVVSFETQNVPVGTAQIHIQFIVDAFSGKATPLEATIPFHTDQKTIVLKKTVTSKGVSLTLDRLVITGSTTLIYVKPSSPLTDGLYVIAMSVNGQSFTYTGSQTDSGGTVGSPDLAIRLSAILDMPGTWTLKVAEGGYPAPRTWTFTFTVPAN